VTRFQTVADLAVDNALPESWVDAVRINLAYLTVAGADLTSGSTINPTAGFHKVTGTTTINNIVDLSTATKGQPLTLYFTGALTLHHNGGGAGQLYIPGGNDKVTSPNDVIHFVYDNAGDQWVMVADKLYSSQSQLAADVTATTSGTFYDANSLSLTAGTWLVFAVATVTTGNGKVSGKLWDGGSNVYASAESADTETENVIISRIALTATTTVKHSVTRTGGTTLVIKAAMPDQGQGNNATTMVAVRVQ